MSICYELNLRVEHVDLHARGKPSTMVSAQTACRDGLRTILLSNHVPGPITSNNLNQHDCRVPLGVADLLTFVLGQMDDEINFGQTDNELLARRFVNAYFG